MANADVPNGLKPVRTLIGSPYNGATRRAVHAAGDSVALFIGDLVKLTGAGDATDNLPVVAQAAAGNSVCGVVVGMEPDYGDLSIHYVAASTRRIVYVAMDPNLIFEVQEDSTGGSIAVASIGLNTDVVVGTGSTTTGTSAMELDSSDVGTSAGQLKLLQLAQREDNVLGNYANWEVMIAEHQLRDTVGTDV
jgi:hypothetical protein